jgi:hypothetical protein
MLSGGCVNSHICFYAVRDQRYPSFIGAIVLLELVDDIL